MITGVHLMLNSKDAEATRAFFRDALNLASVDAGRGWLIFALPPSELGIHPTDGETGADMYFMCDNVEQTVTPLVAAGAEVTHPVSEQGWGRLLMLRIPGEVSVGLYEARHPTALKLAMERAAEMHKNS